MDRVDRQILAILQTDGRLTNTEVADRVNLTPSPCLRRIRELEQSGVIRGYRALIDGAAIGFGFEAFAIVTMHDADSATICAFESRIEALLQVTEAHRLFGNPDYLLRIATADLPSYERFYTNELSALPGIARVTSLLAMKHVKRDQGLPVEP